MRRIDVGAVKDVIWSDNGELVAIAGDASFYILQVGTGWCDLSKWGSEQVGSERRRVRRHARRVSEQE